MASDWEEVSLNSLTSKITKGTTPTKKDGGFRTSGINYIKSEAVTKDGMIEKPKFTFISSDVHNKFKRSQLEENDILMSMAGINLGKTAIVKKEHLPANTNQALAIIRPIDEKIHPKYLFYFLRQPSVVYFINNSTSQSAQPNINLQEIGSLKIKTPSFSEQKAIAHILGTLDDKIELNRKMNETLEAMAQALFKSWFVDFDPVLDNALQAGNTIPDDLIERAEQRQALLDSGEFKQNTAVNALFPSEFEFSEDLGWIPRGWVVKKIADEIETVGGGTPSTKNPNFWEGGDIHWTTPKDLSGSQNKILLQTNRKITKLGLSKISSGLLPVDTVLMSSRAPVGYLALAKVPVAINQGYIAFKCNTTMTPEYAIQWAESSMDEIKQRAGGTTFSEISKGNFRDIDILVPDKSPIDKYSREVKAIYNKITENERNAQTLAKLRDTLLPKLMSGELRLDDAVTRVEEV